jgi:hypothetical protein
MNCPSCGTPAPTGAAHCKRCGKPLGAKPAAAAAASDEIDLMPLEESKAPAHSTFEPPAGLALPGALGKAPKDYSKPPEPGDPVSKIRGASGAPPKSKTNLIVGCVIAVLVVGFIGWRVLRTKNEVVVGKAKVETTVSLLAGATRVENVEITGQVPYTFEVTATDGDVLMAIFQRSPKDLATLPALKKLAEGFETVKKGDTHSMSGTFMAGQYSWAVANEGKKPVRAKVKFVAQP